MFSIVFDINRVKNWFSTSLVLMILIIMGKDAHAQCSIDLPTGLFDNIQNLNGPNYVNSSGNYTVCSGEDINVTGNGSSNFWLEADANLTLNGTNSGYIIASNANTVIIDGTGANTIYALAGSEVTVNSGNITVYAQCGASVINNSPLSVIFVECFDDVENSENSATILGCVNMNFNLIDPPTPIIDLGGYQEYVCADGPILLDASASPGPYAWSNGETTSSILVEGSGLYIVEVPGLCSTEIGVAEINFTDGLENLFLGLTSDYCADELPITLDAGPGFSDYIWSNGETGQIIEVHEHGQISVEAEGGCVDGFGQLVLMGIAEPPELNLGPNFDGCAVDFPITLDAENFNSTYSWSTSENTSSIEINSMGTYSVTISNYCTTQANLTQTFTWNMNDYLGVPPPTGLPDDFSVCEEEFPLTIQASEAFQNYEWSTLESGTSSITINSPGTYAVTVDNSCAGQAYGEVTVSSLGSAPTLELPDLSVCEDEFPLTVYAPPGFDTYDWSTGGTNSGITLGGPVDLSIEVSNVCGVAMDNFSVTSDGAAPELDLGADIELCEADFPYVLDPGVYENYSWSNNSTNSTFSVNQAQIIELTVSNSCGSDTDQIEFISLGSAPDLDLGEDLSLCEAEFPYILSAPGFDTYLWSSLESGDQITVTEEGTYSLDVSNVCGTDYDEITFTNLGLPPTLDLGADISLCDEEFPILIDAGDFPEYEWSTEEQTQIIEVSEPQMLELSVSNACGTDSDDLEIMSLGSVPILVFADFDYVCDDEFPYEVNAPLEYDTYLWSTGETTTSIILNEPQVLSLEVSNVCGSDTEEFEVVGAGNLPELDLGEDIILCEEELPITLDGGVYDNYWWSVGEAAQSVSIATPQTVTLTVTNQCGSTTDEIEIISNGTLPNLELGENVAVCDVDFPFTFSAPEGFDTYLWNTADNGASITVDSPQLLSLEVTNNCGSAVDEIEITSAGIAPVLDLGEDLELCEADFPITIDGGEFDSYLWSTNETSSQITINEPQAVLLMVTSQCGFDVDEINVIGLGNTPSSGLDAVQNFCEASYPLSFTAPELTNTSYVWSNGSLDAQTTISEPGMVNLTLENNCGTHTEQIEFTGLGESEQELTLPLCEGEILQYDNLEITEPGEYYSFNPSGGENGCGVHSYLTVPLISLISDTTHLEMDPGGFVQIEGNTLTEPGTYYFYNYNFLTGCNDEHVVNVEFSDNSFNVFIPSSFTPDNSGLNDVFTPIIHLGNDVKIISYEFQIFNRYGELIYQSNDYLTTSWVGDALQKGEYYAPNGVYNWVMKIHPSTASQPEVYSGFVTILR